MRERAVQTFLEQEPELLAAFGATYVARWDTYPYQLPDGSYARAGRTTADGKREDWSLTDGQLRRHLQGQITLGAYLLSAENTTTRIVLDDDDENAGISRLLEISQGLAAQAIPSYLERSRRGGHLWIHTPPLSGKAARQIGLHLLAQAGYNRRDIELYPKQAFLHGDQVGSLIRLPLGMHRKTGQVYGFVDLQGHDLAERLRDQLRLVSQPLRVTSAQIAQLLAQAPALGRQFTVDRTRLKRYSADMPLDERIKRAIAPRDYIGQYVDLDGDGRGLCPFHDDHRQSLKVYDDGWHCFAGCEGQTIIDFAIKMRGYPSLALPAAEWKQVLYQMLKQLGF